MSKYDINRDLLSACRENDVRLASVLIELGADIDKKDCQGISALAVSVFENNIEMTKVLLDNNANVNISVMDGLTPLMLASANTEDIEMTKLLIENGANIDELDDDGNCALMYCFSEENKSFANLLIKNGANIDIADKNGNTPLMKAVQRGNIDFVKLKTLLTILTAYKRKTLWKIQKILKKQDKGFYITEEMKGKRIQELNWKDIWIIVKNTNL